jgi:hypothetical protein
MTSPLLDTAGTLTISDSSQSPPLSIPATIKVSPVVPEEALYVSVLQRVLAMDRFGAALAAEGRDSTAVRSAILNQANLQQPTLTPDQYDRLVSLARNFDAERSTVANQYRPLLTALNGQTPQDQSLQASSVAQLGMPPRYLAMVKAADTGIGAAFAPFSTFAWANYAPNVEGFLPNPTGEFTLYLDHAIAQDPGTGKISVTSWASVDSLGYYGNEVDLNETLYHVAGGDEWHFQSDHGAGFAAVTLALQPTHIGDFYQSDADASARVFNQEQTATAVANTSVSVLAYSCRPVIRDDGGGFTVDGVPTNGFVAGPGSGRSGSITIYGQCLDDVTQITFSGLPGLTATRSGSPMAVAGSPIPGLRTLIANYQASDAGLSADPAAAMWGFMLLNTADGRNWAHPAVLAKKLPAITAVIPYPWQSGSVVPYTIYGAGFGANPAVSIVLDNQATVGQPVVTKCVPIACFNNFIDGTVALLPEVVPDWATVTVGYAGYLSFVTQATPAGGQGAARVPVMPAGAGQITSVSVTTASWTTAVRDQGILYKKNTDWKLDNLTDADCNFPAANQGDICQLIVNPVWRTGSQPVSDPALFLIGEKPLLDNIGLNINADSSGAAVLRVSTNRPAPNTFGSPVAVQFTHGTAIVTDRVVSDQNLPDSIQNIDLTVNWELLFDGGATFPARIGTPQKLFVTLRVPQGFAGGDLGPINGLSFGIDARPHATAKRVDRATGDLAGNDSTSVALSAAKALHDRYGFGNATFAESPWSSLDQSLRPIQPYDCISLSSMTVVELLQVGYNVGLTLAYPTFDDDATSQKVNFQLNPAQALYWYLGQGDMQNFEAYFIDKDNNSAYTAAPVGGPIAPHSTGYYIGSDGNPMTTPIPQNIPPAQLASAVIYGQLKAERAGASRPGGNSVLGGRRFWEVRCDNCTTTPLTEVPFPARIP